MASFVQLIPLSELAPGQAAAIRNSIVDRMVADAVRLLNLTADRLVVRDIRAKDDITLYTGSSAAGVEDWGCITGTTANAYETMATGTMGDQRFMGIFGLKVTENLAVSALKFSVGNSERAIWQLQQLSEEDSYVGFSPSGIIIPAQTIYTISRFVRNVSNLANIVLKGVIVEPRGLVISP